MISHYNRLSLIEDYKNGMTLEELTSKYSCSRITIKRIFEKYNIKRDESIYTHKIREAYNQGWSIYRIVKEFHINRRTIYRICHDLIPKKINTYTDDIMNMYYLYLSGVDKQYLCISFNIDSEKFDEWILEAKIILKGDEKTMSRKYLTFAEICLNSYETFKDHVKNMNNNDLKQTYIRMKDFCEKDHVMDIIQVASNLKCKYEYICEIMKSREISI